MFKPNLAIAPEGPITFPKIASPKLDGIRCLTIEDSALSRSLKPIPNHHVRQLLRPYQGLDGELILGSPTAPDVYRQTNSAVMSHDGEPAITFYIFDNLTSNLGFSQRVGSLVHQNLPDYIQVLRQTLIESQAQLDAYYEELTALGYEGAILRNPNALYKYGRATAKSQDMLKLKPWADSEAVVVAVEEEMFNGNDAETNELGRTQRSTKAEGLIGKNTLGALIVQDCTTGVIFKVGTGFSATDRIELWLRKPVGLICKYKYFTVGVKDKPRHPVFLGWRDRRDM